MNDVPTFLWRVFAVIAAAFMLSPLTILVLFCFSERSLVMLPITGLTFAWFEELFARPAF
jgi:ABC-type spermidine/putrescine transport system permease subunit II